MCRIFSPDFLCRAQRQRGERQSAIVATAGDHRGGPDNEKIVVIVGPTPRVDDTIARVVAHAATATRVVLRFVCKGSGNRASGRGRQAFEESGDACLGGAS